MYKVPDNVILAAIADAIGRRDLARKMGVEDLVGGNETEQIFWSITETACQIDGSKLFFCHFDSFKLCGFDLYIPYQVVLKTDFHKAAAEPRSSGAVKAGMQLPNHWHNWFEPLNSDRKTQPAPQEKKTFKLGDQVQKKSGSQWVGTVVGTYSTALTPEGYAVESRAHGGSVQIYPVAALEQATV